MWSTGTRFPRKSFVVQHSGLRVWDPCGSGSCDNLVDARPSYQLGSVRIWNLQWGGRSRLRWGEVAPDVMVPPWCHGVGGVWGRHGEVAVVFLLQIAVGATWVVAELRGNRFSTEAGLLLGPAGVACGGRGAAHRSRSVWVLPRRLWIRGEVTSHKISSEPAKTTAEAESGSGIPFGAARPGLLRHHPCGSGSG